MPKVLRISECLTGADFENTILNILVNLGFDAHLTGKEDRGIDIIASKTVDEKAYKFYIQCKFWNTTVGMKPIQEAFTGCHYFGNDGTPVVITNNRVTIEARQYARKLGVEVIGKAELEEIRCSNKKGGKCDGGVTGLQGLLMASLSVMNTWSECPSKGKGTQASSSIGWGGCQSTIVLTVKSWST